MNLDTVKIEEEKLLRRRKKALDGSNKRTTAEAHDNLASFYYSNHRYGDALDEFKAAASLYKELGLRLEWGHTCRMIAEVYMYKENFLQALKYEERHLYVAKELNNLVEEQRAMATIGRIYLLQAESLTTTEIESNKALQAAEKAFKKGLTLCDRLNDKINKHELTDMRARLLLNIGLVQEQLTYTDKATEFIQKAIAMSSNFDLYETLHLCYVSIASIYTNKKDYANSLSYLNKAFEAAGHIEDKILKQCETLLLKGDILCKMSDYQSAKQVLLKAWKMKTPDENEMENIEKNLRAVAAICDIEDQIITTGSTDHGKLKKLYEKLGDCACQLKNYGNAVEYYLKMLEQAELAGDCGRMLQPIYISLCMTYKDMGCYKEALMYYEKEYELVKDEPKEAFVTLTNMADVLFLAKKPYDQIEKVCLEARETARNSNKKKHEIRILKILLKYQEEYIETDKKEETKSELRALGCDSFDLDQSDDEDMPCSMAIFTEDVNGIGADICLDDLTDLSDNEDETANMKRQNRARGRSIAVKKNDKGETQLHLACISGNKVLVERLLDNRHPVNVRDHAGWSPLHEACNYGHTEIVSILVDNGANVNDRGGSMVNGTTPLYDAATNGHLETIQLLLDKGAIPSLKTDSGATPLQALHAWRSKSILSKDEETLYKTICSRMSGLIDKTPAADQERFKSKTPVKTKKDITPPSTSKNSNMRSPMLRRNIIDMDYEYKFPEDTSDSNKLSIEESIILCNKNYKSSGLSEYRNTMSALRNRSLDDSPEVSAPKEPEAALIEADKICDDWLDDDLGICKGKKRKMIQDPLTIVVAKRPVYDSIKDTIDDINNYNDPAIVNSKKTPQNKTTRIEVISDNDSDVEEYKKGENIIPRTNLTKSFDNITKQFKESRSKDSREKMLKRCKRQSTLFKSGFHRKFDSDNSGSDTEICNRSKKDYRFSTSSGPSLGIENQMNGNYRHNENFSMPNIGQPMNVLQQLNMQQTNRNNTSMGQIVPPTAVKVHVGDKMFLISLKLQKINKLTISWLVEEVKSRYYKLTGTRPVFTLMTSDGAIISEDDPLSLVLTSPELKTCITNWKPLPAEERYLECCDALRVEPSQEIQQAIGRSHTTHRLALGSQTLLPSQIRPLFRALTHQTHITAFLISDNNLGDESMKHLTDCICTMKNLSQLDISSNNFTSEGMKMLLSMYENPNRPVSQSLQHFDASNNPIGDIGFRNICKLGQYLKLKVLKLINCKITHQAFSETNKPSINFDSLEVFDISNNDVKQGILNSVVCTLNPNLLTELYIGNVGVDGHVIGMLATFLDSSKQLKLRRLDLSNWKMTDGQFMRLFRSLSRAPQLQSITLKNNLITFIILKKLLQRQPPIPQINLEGCHDIFKFSPDSDFHTWLPTVNFGRCIPELTVTPVLNTDRERDSFKSFQNIWLKCFNSRGIIEHCDREVVKFTAQ